MTRTRLDQHLVDREVVPSRARARDLIRSGHVLVDGKAETKPARSVEPGAHIELSPDANIYVSRAALKLVHALAVSGIDPAGRIALDIGASTGGFSQVLAERRASKVYAIDVGRDQLHETLRANPAIVSLEGRDARNLTADLFPERPDLLVCDASFISLEKVLPVPMELLAPHADLIALIKPQFEVGRDLLPRDGVVKSKADREAVRQRIIDWLNDQPGWQVHSTDLSPISGKSGNIEYLIWARRDPDAGEERDD